MTNWHIAVLVPAKNEEMLLPRCLASIERARHTLPDGVTSDVIVVADSSNDRTFQIAEAMLGNRGLAMLTDVGCVGSARVLAAVTALERTRVSFTRCWLANTDADCEVPENWLTSQLMMALGGIEAVAGIVDVDTFEEHHPRVSELFRKTYLIGEDGTHPHVHGANLGIRADAYVGSGGWGQLHTAEDHDLWSRLGSRGYRRLSDAGLFVITSGRRIGRAPQGFADALAAHNNEVAV